MSSETVTWLNRNTLIGFTDQRGHAWHWRRDADNHYPGPVPVADVERRLFNWEAVSRPIYVPAPAGELAAMNNATGELVALAEVLDRQAIMHSRTGHVMGVFKTGYQPHQYREWLLTQVANLLDAGLAVGSAGLLRNGAQAWVSVEVPDNITTPQGVEFRANLLAVTSFDGSLATTYKRVVTNVVCDNTMAAGLAERGQQFKVKHSKNSRMKLADARDALAIVHTVSDDFAAEVRALCETSVSEQQWRQFLDAHRPLPADRGAAHTRALNERRHLRRLWDHDQRVSPWRGTAWGVMQAVNTYTHHLGTVRNMSRAERNMARAAQGEVDTLDQSTAATLAAVLG